MADSKVVRGTLGGVAITTTEETADLLGADFEPAKSTSKSSSSKK